MRPRMTLQVRLVLAQFSDHTDVPDGELYGRQICEATSLKPGTVYPILIRLERVGWLVSDWEPGRHPGRPPRRYYRLTGEGWAAVRQERALQRSQR